MSTSTPAQGGLLRSLQFVGGAMSSAVILVNVVLYLVMPHDATPPLIGVGVLIIVGIASFLLSRTMTGRVSPISAATPPDVATRQAAARFSSLVFTRYALAEVPALVGVVLGFVLEPSTWFTSLIGLVVSAPLLLLCWPSQTAVDNLQSQLESEGARTSLSQYLTDPGQR